MLFKYYLCSGQGLNYASWQFYAIAHSFSFLIPFIYSYIPSLLIQEQSPVFTFFSSILPLRASLEKPVLPYILLFPFCFQSLALFFDYLR